MSLPTITLSRTRLAAGEGQDLDLLLTFPAPPPPKDASRQPLCILPVVDVSGSMRGEKLAGVRKALVRLAEHLHPGDFLGLVTFDSSVEVRMRPVELTEATRARFIKEAQSLHSGSSTNLSGGLLEGAILLGSGLPQGMRARVLALTDGRANEGIARSPDELRSLVKERFTAVSLSCYGYGQDCDQPLLADLAEAGGGSFAFIDSEDAVLTAFARELGGLVSTFAADVRVRVVPEAGAPVEERLGDLLHGGSLSFVARVPVAGGAAGTRQRVARVEVRWRDGRGAEQSTLLEPEVQFVRKEDADHADVPAVARARDQRMVREAQEAAEEFARHDDFRRAVSVLEEAVARVRDPALAAFVREQLLPAYRNREDWGGGTRQRASAYSGLKGKRQLLADDAVAAALHIEPSEAEKDMEASFRRPRGRGGNKAQ